MSQPSNEKEDILGKKIITLLNEETNELPSHIKMGLDAARKNAVKVYLNTHPQEVYEVEMAYTHGTQSYSKNSGFGFNWKSTVLVASVVALAAISASLFTFDTASNEDDNEAMGVYNLINDMDEQVNQFSLEAILESHSQD